MFLLFNMLSSLVIAFLPRNKCLLISCLQSTPAVILEHKKIKSLIISIVSPSICHEVMGPDAKFFECWVLSQLFSLSSFTFIKSLLDSSSFSAIRVGSCAYLRLLIFLLAILILACASSSPAFSMMYSAYGTTLQYSCLENPMDGGAWKAAIHEVAEGRTRLSDFTFTFMHWRRKWQPTPVFLPGESQGWRAWWAAVYGVAQSRTQLKWLSSSSSTLHMLNKQGDNVKHHNRVFQKVVKVKWHH